MPGRKRGEQEKGTGFRWPSRRVYERKSRPLDDPLRQPPGATGVPNFLRFLLPLAGHLLTAAQSTIHPPIIEVGFKIGSLRVVAVRQSDVILAGEDLSRGTLTSDRF